MKKVKIVFIIFLLMPSISYAQVKCSEIVESYNTYINYSSQTSNIDCSKSENLGLKDVNLCNNLELRKSLELSKLYKYEKTNNECFNASMQQVLDDNRNKCSSIIDEDLKDLLKKILMIFYLVGPILVVIFGSLDFTKALVASDEKAMKKARDAFVKRLIALLLLLLSPEIVNLLLGLIDDENLHSLNAYSCNYNYLTYTPKITVEGVKIEKNIIIISNRNINNSDDSIIFKQGDYNDNLLCGTEGDTIASAGCALTSVVIQIKNSDVPTILSDLNPSTFNTAIVNSGLCPRGTDGDSMHWDEYVNYVTNGNLRMHYYGNISGDYSKKVSEISNYLNEGYYPVIQVEHGGSHYVAVVGVSNGELIVVNPAYKDDRTISPLRHDYPFYKDNYDSQIILYEKQ